jgi:hypothetical protein
MKAPQITTVLITVVLGILVLSAYASVFKGESYMTSKYWLGTPQATIKLYIALQLLAAIGFITAMVALLTSPPKRGLLTYLNAWALPLVIAVILGASLIWPFALQAEQRYVTVGSLIVVAAGSIALLAGTAENLSDDSTSQYAFVGVLTFCIVTVLLDAVGWNARYIMSNMS